MQTLTLCELLLLLLQYRQLDGSTFTFTRNALIQRMVDITAKQSEEDIHQVLNQHGLPDRGRKALEGVHQGLQGVLVPP
jgi:hypothetical protein